MIMLRPLSSDIVPEIFPDKNNDSSIPLPNGKKYCNSEVLIRDFLNTTLMLTSFKKFPNEPEESPLSHNSEMFIKLLSQLIKSLSKAMSPLEKITELFIPFTLNPDGSLKLRL